MKTQRVMTSSASAADVASNAVKSLQGTERLCLKLDWHVPMCAQGLRTLKLIGSSPGMHLACSVVAVRLTIRSLELLLSEGWSIYGR
ncbi:hypothetical protein CFBP498_49320 (plasmid) [Xanthomonas hortorum pv. vitians]|uniref:Uncharacterized protein n=1 Tax=Xanthomonas hortorum pv. vitians TaxID=83224 RepID=A0A6V7FJ12_9XANT|nr:hypothetical protein CFBP498_49320 [Xanthomonas hortorum pv. vitians]CAD0363735.1 hypothetical protein CFBP498_49320 [Xanthomonas hortorum pv. vitians]